MKQSNPRDYWEYVIEMVWESQTLTKASWVKPQTGVMDELW